MALRDTWHRTLMYFGLADEDDYEEAVEPYHIEVRHPDDFLLDQLDLYEEATRRALQGIVDAWQNPPFTAHQILDVLGKQGVPRFAAEGRRLFPGSSVRAVRSLQEILGLQGR